MLFEGDEMKPYTDAEFAAIGRAMLANNADGAQLACALDPARAPEACGMLDDMEARCGWSRAKFAAAYDIIAKRSPMRGFLASFPMIETDVSTGGDCMAWTLTLATGEQLMITSGVDGGYPPQPSDERICIGYYDACGEWDGIDATYTWAEATAFVAGFLKGKAK